ncbi:MAG: LacI family DNA-binding transcriptional regulator, partial [Clostridia bacterium]|nr:LacI family DNA-binding transcriptional regulator [Clostridia bacterium]
MVIYALCQRGNSSHWTSQYLKGIKEETKRKGHELQILECSLDVQDLPKDSTDINAAIVISGTYNWTNGICSLLTSKNIKPVVVGYDQFDDITATGYVLMDYKKAVYDLLEYFISSGRRRVALFAVSPESPADKLKSDAFLSYTGADGERFDQKDIFYFRQMTINTCQSFISVCSDYDAVIGTNDVSTAILVDMLKTHGIKVPDDIF